MEFFSVDYSFLGMFSSLCLGQVQKIGCDSVTSHQIWSCLARSIWKTHVP